MPACNQASKLYRTLILALIFSYLIDEGYFIARPSNTVNGAKTRICAVIKQMRNSWLLSLTISNSIRNSSFNTLEFLNAGL